MARNSPWRRNALDGIYDEVETGTPIARDGATALFSMPRHSPSATAAPKTSQASDRAVSATQAEAEAEAEVEAEVEEEKPKLCQDPGQDAPHGASERAERYQEQISALNNPQRPLSAGIAVSLTNPATGKRVVFDDCRESDGTMIEAKGPGFAKMMESDFMSTPFTSQPENPLG